MTRNYGTCKDCGNDKKVTQYQKDNVPEGIQNKYCHRCIINMCEHNFEENTNLKKNVCSKCGVVE